MASMSESFHDPDEAHTIAAYLRIASVAVAMYDFLETSPTTWQFYKEQWASRRLASTLVLFSLIQITSICALVLSSVGFFYEHFTQDSCNKFCLIPPAFKVIQAMVSQAILGIRAYNLSRRSRRLGCLLLLGYVVVVVMQWIASLYHRQPELHPIFRNCRAASNTRALGAWVYYAIAMIYDLATTVLTVFYLLKYKFSSSISSVISHLTKMMLYDGLGYFVVLTGVNVLNLILYRSSHEIQTAAASLGYCVSWIMSQRLLVHLYHATREHSHSIDAAITITHHLGTSRDVNRAIRSQFDSKRPGGPTPEAAVPDGALDFSPDSPERTDVQVRIERTIKLEHRSRAYELETYSSNHNASYPGYRDTHSRK